MSINPMNKMFSGKKYTEPSNEPKATFDEKNMDIKELEKFYKRVRDVQLNEICVLIKELNRANDKKLDAIAIRLNNILNKDIVDYVDNSLQSYKTDLEKTLDQNYYVFNKRLTSFEKFIFLFGMLLFLLLLPNVVILTRWIYSHINNILLFFYNLITLLGLE